ncbi:MAG: glycosyltransferase family 4 protein [Bacteroidota bacterium]
MRIAILQGAFLPVPALLGGAVEKMWFSLGKEFAKNGHEVVHVSRSIDQLPNEEVIDGVQHFRIKGYATPASGIVLKGLDLLYTIRARKLFAEEFDIVISNTFWAPLFLPVKARRVCMVDVQRMPKKQMKLYRNTAILRANSNPVATAIRNELPKVYHEKVVMIPNPLPFTPQYKVDFAEKKPTLLYTGRIHPEKGLHLLVEAFKKTANGYTLKIVGPWQVSAGGGGEAYLEQLRKLAGDAPIEFTGPVYDVEALNKFYIDASIFVYPSVAEQGETFGLSPLEAMAWGCVPVVSALGCFQDFITHGLNGLIFDHRSAEAVDQLAAHISALQKDKKYCEHLATEALAVRLSHSTAHIAELFLAAFKNICQTAPQQKIIAVS